MSATMRTRTADTNTMDNYFDIEIHTLTHTKTLPHTHTHTNTIPNAVRILTQFALKYYLKRIIFVLH